MRPSSMTRLISTLGLLAGFLATLPARAQIITTAAGSTWIFRGNGQPAINAPTGQIESVVLDPSGNVVASDGNNNIVFRVSPNGTLTVLAGNGFLGFSGESGLATNAAMGGPAGITFDGAGNLYITDVTNSRVRRVTPGGIISTYAGNGTRGYSGDGGPATSASLNQPYGVAVDTSGNLYIADRNNNRIRQVSPNGIITTVAGNGTAGFSGDGGAAATAMLNGPLAVTVDSAGNFYISDTLNNRIRKVSSGNITTVAGSGVSNYAGDGGSALSAAVYQPGGINVDSSGNLYIATGGGIRKVTPAGSINTIAGGNFSGFTGDGGQAVNGSLNLPSGSVVDSSGNLYIADSNNCRVRKVSPSGMLSTVAGNCQFKYGGDGGPATSAYMDEPQGVSVDPSGNLYISDSGGFFHRIRKVTPAGTISTFAGSGGLGDFCSADGVAAASADFGSVSQLAFDAAGSAYFGMQCSSRVVKIGSNGLIVTVAGSATNYGFSGDGGPATSALLNSATGVAFDGSGNLYIADTGNERIRKVSGGIITTIAGNGASGFSGDGGAATAAAFNMGLGGRANLAVDASGNLYVADTLNHRVRKISGGIVTTVAGNGTPGFSPGVGDGGPATSASVTNPLGVALDTAGNLYVTDQGGGIGRIRKVSPGGMISTYAGSNQGQSLGDGGPATSAVLKNPASVAVDAAGNLYIADPMTDRVREVLAAAPTFSVTPASLGFTAPCDPSATATQQLVVSSSVPGLAWQASVSTGSSLSISPASGITPGIISVTIGSASQGPTGGSITVVGIGAGSQTVPVQVALPPCVAPHLTVGPASLSFQGVAGGSNPASQSLQISGVSWTAQAATASGGSWLSISPSSSATGAAVTMQVSLTLAGLAAGVYTGAVVVTDSNNNSKTVPVTLIVQQPLQTILLSQSGLQFTGVAGGGPLQSQSIGVVNTGQGTMNWNATPSSPSGSSWLTVSPASGTSVAGSSQVSSLTVTANVTGLAAGQYSALIQVSAPGANNSPQFAVVELSVLPAGSDPGVMVRPSGLIFTAQVGKSDPSSQTLQVTEVAPETVNYAAGLLTAGGNWAQALPLNAQLTPGDSTRTIVVQPSLGTLAPGVYRGALTFVFGDNGPLQVVNLLFLVTGAGSTVDAAAVHGATTSSCSPTQLLGLFRSLGSNFSSPVSWPTSIELQVSDDCGNAITNATVVATFSNGDPPLALSSLQNGIYTGTWRPVSTAGQVTVTARVLAPPLATAVVTVQGQVGSNASAPVVFSGGLVNAASFAPGAPLPPGGMVSVFGGNMATSSGGASTVPLPLTLGGASVSIGGISAPLFYSSGGQINAQIPFELPVNSRPQVVVSQGGALTVPEGITVAPTAPGIFAKNQQGSGQGAILNAQYVLVDASAPAAAGDVVQVFATGLGATNPAVASGAAAPGAPPLAQVVATVTATIGGQPAQVQFAGLAPTFVGLYQVNVQIPSGLPPGPAALVLTAGPTTSNTVTLMLK